MKQTHLSFSILFVWVLLSTLTWGQDEASLTGAVLDQSSAPIAKVSVTLYSLDRVFQTESGADGQFRFPNISPGTYDLEVSAAGFVKQKLPLHLSTNDARTLTLVLKIGSMPDMNYCGPHPSIQYQSNAPKERQVAGTVRDYVNKRPIVKAQIALLRVGERQPILTGRSDRTGRFTLDNPPIGRYLLRIGREDYWPEEVKELLVPQENSVHLDVSLLKRNRIVVCQ